jgi:hypothetical protein
LPDGIRPEFYRRFDAVRMALVVDKLPAEIDLAKELAVNLKGIRAKLLDGLKLEKIELGDWLEWFIGDPATCLTRVLFDPLFDLLKGKIDAAGFEKHATAVTAELFGNLFRVGYDRWGTLSLIAAVDPDEAFVVPVADRSTDPALGDAELIPGHNEARLPPAERAQKLAFDLNPFVELLVPRVIVHSKSLDAYVAFRNDYQVVFRREMSFKDPRRWSKTADIWAHYGKEDLWPDLGLYIGESPEQLALIADYFNIAKPELAVEFMERTDWYGEKGVSSVDRHFQISQPRMGSFVVCRAPTPEEILHRLKPETGVAGEAEEQSAGESQAQKREPDALLLPGRVEVIQAGYAAAALAPIVNRLTEAGRHPE